MASMAAALSPAPPCRASPPLHPGLTSSPTLFCRTASSRRPYCGLSSKAPPFSSLLSLSRPRHISAATAAEEGVAVEAFEAPDVDSETDVSAAGNEIDTPKVEGIFAVVMVGSRQYIVFPGRSICTQRLKGANVNDKIILNRVLLVGTKTNAYIGKPVVTNAAVHAVVEEQGLNKKVIVFKFKRKKHYKRTIGHRQPNTLLKITGITGYEDFPASPVRS